MNGYLVRDITHVLLKEDASCKVGSRRIKIE